LKKILYILFIFNTLVLSTFAQTTQEEFGKNRIQYKNFEWKYLSTANFDIYFYDGGLDIAQQAAKYAELDYEGIIEKIDYAPYTKLKLILYNCHDDLLQSNIRNFNENPALGGQTQFINTKIEIPFEGNQLEFRSRIRKGVAEYLITDMMYGGNIKDIYRNSLLLVLPEWYISGAAAFIANGWDNKMDDKMRDIFSHKKVISPNHIGAYNPELIGQSVFHFLQEKGGKNAISSALSITRITRNYEHGFSASTGFRYRTFEREWIKYYFQNSNAVIEGYTIPVFDKALKNRKNKDYFRVKHSPNGQYIAYSSNEKGKYTVWVLDTKTDKKTKFLSGGFKTYDQEENQKTPLLAWKSDKVLSVIEVKKSKITMTTEDVTGGPRVSREFGTFEQVLDFDYSDDGNNIIFSGEKGGQSDIFLFNSKTNQIKQITNDLFDDHHPCFVKGGYSFVFSSNRTDDTLYVRKVKISQIMNSFDIFLFDPFGKNFTKLKQITHTPFNETNPVSISPTEICFLSDESGVANVKLFNNKDTTFRVITDFQQDISHFDISYNKTFSFIQENKMKEQLFPNYPLDLKANKILPVIPRMSQHLFHLKSTYELLQQPEIKPNTSNPVDINFSSNQSAPADTSIPDPNSSNLIFDSQNNNSKANKDKEITFGSNQQNTNKPIENQNPTNGDDDININNYVFDSDLKKDPLRNIYGNKTSDSAFNLHPNEVLTTHETKTEESIKISDYTHLKPSLNLDNTISSAFINKIGGFGVLLEADVSDWLENHKFSGGVYSNTSLTNSNIYLSYEYLKKRIDYKFTYSKRRIEASDTTNNYHKYGNDMLELGIIYPISPSARICFTPFFIYDKHKNISKVLINNDKYDGDNVYLGGKAEFVFDNTTSLGMNMIHGTKMRIFAENYASMKEDNKSYVKYQIDIRNYKKIHREIVFATRFTSGHYGGKAPKNYLIGGMDNWIFWKNETQTAENNPLKVSATSDNRDWFYNQYVTNLRGFNFNRQFGNSHILANAELRIPLIKYFYRGLITSHFLRNFQVVGFYDIGTAWTGDSPFNTNNSQNSYYKYSGNFRIKVTNYESPFLRSYGVGIRTYALGYYAKLDLAFPVINTVRQTPKLMLSLGYDF